MVQNVLNIVTEKQNFYGKTNPFDLIQEFGSPLYVYSEAILRERCRDMKSLLSYPDFQVNYSAKANSSLALLKIVREEGLSVDAMSPGEILVNLKAGFKPENILYIGNNVSAEELKFAVDAGVSVSVDSVSQLELFGKINPGGKVYVRFNPGIGTGHHKKVMTAGKDTKFGVFPELIPDVKSVLKKYNLKLTGINQHIGSLFLSGTPYIKSIESLLAIAENFLDLDVIDLGGGFGVPYRIREGEQRLDLKALGQELDAMIESWTKKYGKKVKIKVEPGRYIPAESGILLGTVHTLKTNYEKKYAGTDIGFNVLMRPVLYNSHHDIEVYRNSGVQSTREEAITIVGNICETGDILADNRMLPELQEGDILGVLNAGAYGYVMSSNYNNRLRPAEVLIGLDGKPKLIRKRDTFEDLVRGFVD